MKKSRRKRATLRWATRRLKRSRLRVGPLIGLAVLGLGLALFSCVSSGPPIDERERAALKGEPLLRVLLVEGAPEAKLAIDGPGSLVPASGPPALVDGLAACAVKVAGGRVTIGERAFAAREVRVSAERAGGAKLDGKPYAGELVISATSAGVRVVNDVRLEDYLQGVIGREMPLNWPDEALRAQAIAARTYALWHWKHRDESADHDLKNDQRSQVYGGVDPSPRAREMVKATEGLVLAWDGRLFEAFFHSTCGGECIPASWTVGGPEIAPLMGAPCGHCVSSKHYVWTKEVEQPELAKALAPFGVAAPITRIETVPWPRAGWVRDVVVDHAKGTTTIPAPKFRFALGLKSSCFAVSSKDGKKLAIEGRGWGHGAGLCQSGAKGWADEGKKGEEICTHYYPGAVVVKLY